MNLSTRVFRTGGLLLPVALMIMLIPCLALASAIGTISLGGSQVVAVNGTDIDFGYCDSGGAGCTTNGGISGSNPPEATAPVSGTGDTGTFTVNTSDVPGIAPSTTAIVADLNNITEPVDTTLSISNFIQFPSADESITLTELLPGEGSPANCGGADGANAGQDCTPASNSPFNLINSAAGVDVFFDFDGTLIDDANSSVIGNVVGEWDQPLAGTSSQAILAALASSSSVAIASSASGSLNISSVPEPGTSAMMLLAGAGLVALSNLRRRRSRS